MFRIRAEQGDGYSGGILKFSAGNVREVWDGTGTVFDTLEDAERWARLTAAHMDHLEKSRKSSIRRNIISFTVLGPLGDMGGYIVQSHLDSLN